MRLIVPIRLICVVATMAAVLVPSLSSPARTIRVPRVLFASATVDRAQGRIHPKQPPTHVGFSWTGTDGGRVRFRTVGTDGSVSPWRNAPENDDLAERDRHFTGVMAVYGALTIQWRRRPPRDGWMGPVTVDLLDSVHGPRREIRIPSVAHGLASEPRIVTRAEWGADESLQSNSGGCRRSFFPVQQLFVHHTAGSNRDPHPRATMRSIYWFHTARRGWCDIAYNFLIARNGTVFEGRWARAYLPWETHDAEDFSGALVRGAHTLDHNPGAVGVSLMGSFGSRRPTKAARRSLVRLLAWEADRHGLAPEARHVYVNQETGARRRVRVIAGHRDVRSTSCPGRALYRMLPGIRRSVARRIGPGKLDTELLLSKSPKKVDFGASGTVTATLTSDASPLPEAPVRLYQKEHGGPWELLTESPTDEAGQISVEVAPTVRMRFAAEYAGSRLRWSAQSKPLKLGVAPVVTLEAQGGTADGAGSVYFPPGTTSIQLAGSVSPPHPGRAISLLIERRDVVGTVVSTKTVSVPVAEDGASYSYVLTTKHPRYRLVASLPGHPDHALGRAPDLHVVVGSLP